MKNKKSFEFELIEFYILGSFIFFILFILLCFEPDFHNITPNIAKNQVSTPAKDAQPIVNNADVISNIPTLTIVNNNNTPDNLDDDIVNYSTSYYSLLLPYNLDHYTNSFGANNSSRQLLTALKQLYSQMLQNKLIENTIDKKSFEQMIDLLSQAITIQDEVYNSINSSSNKTNPIPDRHIIAKLSSINTTNGKLITQVKLKQRKIINILYKQNTPAACEAGELVNILNEHLFLLYYKTYADYYHTKMNKDFDYKDFKKPVIFNIIEIIDKQIVSFSQ